MVPLYEQVVLISVMPFGKFSFSYENNVLSVDIVPDQSTKTLLTPNTSGH